MDLFAITPQVEDFSKQFPGWPTVIAYAFIYLVVGVIAYFLVKAAVVRLMRRQRGKQEAALALPPGPARDRAVENGRRRLGKVQETILRVVKFVIAFAGFVFLVGDLFPSLDMLSGSLSILILGGTALGLAGALQPYIRDVIGGSLLFFEDAYSVGDWVKIGGVEGTVEELHIRRTVVRSSDGAVHNVPNGAVGVATNMSRVWATSTVEIVLAHDVDLDRAIEVADATAATLADDEDWSYRIIDPPRVTRVSDVSPDGVTIRLAGRVVTGEAGVVAGELRRRLHHAYHEAGIPLARRDALLGPVLAAVTRPAQAHGAAKPAARPPAKAPASHGAAAARAAVDDAEETALGTDRRGTGTDPRTPAGRR
jgi:moderate conductance mechanosensitive channel